TLSSRLIPRGLTLRRAAATRHPLVRTLHPAAAMAVEAATALPAVVMAVVGARAATAAEVVVVMVEVEGPEATVEGAVAAPTAAVAEEALIAAVGEEALIAAVGEVLTAEAAAVRIANLLL
ncbi:MAG TPA: hypothetical protein VI431_04735, partial [Candidatus Acidoferrum sp.]